MEEIELGAQICEKIKKLYFYESEWHECHQDVAKKYTLFKKIMRKIYPTNNIIDILKRVQKFDTLDIQEVFEMEGDYLKPEDKEKTGPKKYEDNVVWIPVPIEKVELQEQIRKMLA